MDETFQQTTSLVWDYTVQILEVSEDKMLNFNQTTSHRQKRAPVWALQTVWNS